MALNKKNKKNKMAEMTDSNSNAEIELEQVNIILQIPKEAVALEVTASLLENGKLVKVGKTMSVSEIREARQDFLDNVEDGDDYNARYVLSDEGMSHLRKLMQEGAQDEQ